MNKAILMGRLTKDPEVRYTASNLVYTTFTVAVNRRFASKDQAQQADFINVITWGKTAEFVSMYFKKGQQMSVVGRIQTRNYDDKDGKRVYVTEVVGEEVYFAGGGKSENGYTAPEMNAPEQEERIEFQDFDENEFKIETEDDIQF